MKDYSAVIASIISFAVTALSGYIVIPYLRKLKFGQTILEIGPNWHKDKQGTPTMGGVMLVVGVLLALAVTFSYSMVISGGFALELNDKYKLIHVF